MFILQSKGFNPNIKAIKKAIEQYELIAYNYCMVKIWKHIGCNSMAQSQFQMTKNRDWGK